MKFREIVPLLHGNINIDVIDSDGELVGCLGDARKSDADEYCFEQLKEFAVDHGDREIKRIGVSKSFHLVEIEIE